jgi:hypothetical protein
MYEYLRICTVFLKKEKQLLLLSSKTYMERPVGGEHATLSACPRLGRRDSDGGVVEHGGVM